MIYDRLFYIMQHKVRIRKVEKGMRKGWKMLAAVLGGAVLVCSGYEGVPVRAAESGQQEAELSTAAEAQKKEIPKATDLKWNEKGQGIFTNPNGRCGVRAYVYTPDGNRLIYNPGTTVPGGENTFDLYHLMQESGTYTFEVYLENNSGSSLSERSGEFEYVKPDTKLPAPVVSVSKEGVVSCTLPENEGSGYVLGTDYGFNYELWSGNRKVSQWGTNQSTVNFGQQMKPGISYSVRVCTLSRDIMKYLNSEWSALIPVNPEASVREEEHTKWEPSEEELKLYAACGSEEIEFTADANNAYEVRIENSVQGLMCFASFESVLGDYTIGRTYNIFPSERGMVSQMEDKVRITLTSPEALQADGRTFRMISVTEGGSPLVLEDLDSDSKTITFETNTYYAFALVYSDTAKVKAKVR